MTETTVEPDGTIMTVTYKVGEGDEQTGTAAEAEVTKDEKTVVEFADSFEDNTGILEITKTIEGDLTPEEIAGALTFVVSTTVEEDGAEVNYFLVIEFSLLDFV